MARASTRPLEWSEAARQQLQGIAPPDLVLGRVARAAELLERHPHIGTPGRVAGTREWPIKDSPLTMIYRVRQTKIQVLAVAHQRRFFRGE